MASHGRSKRTTKVGAKEQNVTNEKDVPQEEETEGRNGEPNKQSEENGPEKAARVNKDNGAEPNKAQSGAKKAAAAGAKSKSETDASDFLNIGDIIGGYLQVTGKVSEGGFGQVYTARDSSRNDIFVAVKAEGDLASTTQEIRVLTALQGHPKCPIMYEAGRTRYFTYISMQLLGRNLSQVRRACVFTPTRLSTHSTYGVVSQCIDSIQAIHDVGFLHRDVKPSNFAMGAEWKNRKTVYIFDFGLCRKYVEDGVPKKPRSKSGFRGTVRYASIAAHEGKDLGRRDDMWSLFYTFIELISGQLPWRNVTDKPTVARLKHIFTPETFCVAFPLEIARFVALIRKLEFADKPKYRSMTKCFRKLLIGDGIPDEDSVAYEWECQDCRTFSHWKPPKTVPTPALK